MEGNTGLLLKTWKELEKSYLNLNIENLQELFYRIFSTVFLKINKNELVYYCYKKLEMILSKVNENEAAKVNMSLGYIYLNNENYEGAKSSFKKSIRFLRKFSDNDSFNSLMSSYHGLGRVYTDLGKKKKINKIIQILERMKPSYENEIDFWRVVCWFYCEANKFAESISILWKNIKNCKKREKMNHSYEMIYLYLFLGQAYTRKRDFEKAHKMFTNAKSCIGILSYGNPAIIEVFKQIGCFYMIRSYWQDALMYYEKIKSHCCGYELQYIKLCMGICYIFIPNDDKALELLTEVKEAWYALPEVQKTRLFIINFFIGLTLNDIGNAEQAYFFIEAFKLINFYRHDNLDFYVSLPEQLFYYFLEQRDYEKCEIILQRSMKIIKENSFLEWRLNNFYICWTKLCIYQNKNDEAGQWLYKIEKNLNIEGLLRCPQKRISKDENYRYLDIADIYVQLKFSASETNLLKAEKILKRCEKFKDDNRSDDSWVINLYILLGELYYSQKRLAESKIYFEKLLSMDKQFRLCLIEDCELNNALDKIEEIDNIIGECPVKEI